MVSFPTITNIPSSLDQQPPRIVPVNTLSTQLKPSFEYDTYPSLAVTKKHPKSLHTILSHKNQILNHPSKLSHPMKSLHDFQFHYPQQQQIIQVEETI